MGDPVLLREIEALGAVLTAAMTVSAPRTRSSPGALADALAAGAMRLVGAHDAVLHVACPDAGWTLTRATSPTAQRLHAARRDSARDVIGAIPLGSDRLVVPDLTTDPRWPTCAAVARAVGLRAEVTVRLCPDADVRAHLSVFRRDPGAWPPEAIDELIRLGAHGVPMIALAQRLADSDEVTGQLRHALEARVVIEQAKGVTAAQLGVTTDRAFSILRDHARRTRTTVRSVSEAVVELLLPPPRNTAPPLDRPRPVEARTPSRAREQHGV